jgi:Rrf2 family transcriptional regulator, iron-sulfur cluster assembly transcription factor
MKISRKADYALRAVLYISKQPTDKRNSINAIAESESVPRDFLAKILKELTRAEILKSYQGVHGGYQLAKSPSQVSVLDVIEAMDGPLGINLCVRGEDGCDCEKSERCTMYPFWDKLQKQLKTILKNETLVKLRGGRK